jgi:addiction module HigA family antidote
MLPGALLKQLMQRIWHVANLQRGHCFALHARCMHFACGSSCLGLTPITPGELLDEELLQPLGVSQYRLAKAIDVPASRISEIVAGRRSISPELAEEIARIEPLVVG